VYPLWPVAQHQGQILQSLQQQDLQLQGHRQQGSTPVAPAAAGFIRTSSRRVLQEAVASVVTAVLQLVLRDLLVVLEALVLLLLPQLLLLQVSIRGPLLAAATHREGHKGQS